jgi:HK97 family phage portal protein
MSVRKPRRGTGGKKARPKSQGKITPSPAQSFVYTPWVREAGVLVNADTASQVAAVYGCCRLIVDCIAPAPIVISEIQKGGIREDCPDDAVGWTLNYGAPVDIAPDAPTAQAVEEALYWSALLGDGNGYAEIQRDGTGKLFALWPIESDRVLPVNDETGYWYKVYSYQGGSKRLEAKDMFHLRGPSLKGYVGDSMVYRAAKSIGVASASQVYSAAYFANGTSISGILTSDKVITPQQAKDAKAKWTEEYGGGPSKAHGISVMGSGVKYQAINHTAQEAMLIDQQKFSVAQIARFYGVPLSLLAENEAWTNLSELYQGFYRNCLRAWSERWDSEATRKLLPRRAPYREVTHDLTHLTLGSFKDQVAALVQATGNMPIWTQNEARALFGMNSVPGGDELEPVEPKAAPAPSRAPAPEPEEPDDDEAPDPAELM